MPDTLVITSDSGQLTRVRAWLGEQLSRLGVDPGTQSALQVAVGELVTNSIKHSYEGAAGHPIHLSIESRDDGLVIQLEDFGRPFDPAGYHQPDLEEINESGIGLYIVRRFADELSWDLARERGTRWTLVKYRTGTRPTGSA